MNQSISVFPQFCANTSQRFAGALRRQWAGQPSAVKTAARAVGVNPRTFKTWWDGRTEPRASDLVLLLLAALEVLEREFLE